MFSDHYRAVPWTQIALDDVAAAASNELTPPCTHNTSDVAASIGGLPINGCDP